MRSLRMLIIALLVVSGSSLNFVSAADSRAEVIERVGADIEYLASDALEGRGIQTSGIKLAADHIIDTYKKYGLKPGMPDGTFLQGFDITVGKTQLSSDSSVVFKTADGTEQTLKAGQDYQPLQRGANGSCSGEMVFIGYGITSTEDNYDDYAGIDVDGKVVVMIRREPQQGIVQGAFRGTETSKHAYIDAKVKLAKDHKAVGIVFVNDTHSAPSPDRDELTTPSGFGTVATGLPFVHVKQSSLDKLLKSSPLTIGDGADQKTLSSLSQICQHIDDTLKPVSQPLQGVTANLKTKFSTESVKAFNLIGVIEGEGDLADETIVIGGHYDHLGFGGFGSRAKNRTGEIHNGADDNATGTAAVMEMVRRVASGPKPQRRIVFICFSGEERGLLGSRHYVNNPVFPLEKTVAMLNYDMIGTLRNNRIEVNGVGTATEFRPIVEAADELSPLDIKTIEHPYAGSDHLPFFQKQIPVMFCFTGVTPRYHTPDDDFSTINVDGVVSVIDFTESLLRGIDGLPTAPEFQNVSRRSRNPTKVPFLGVVPNLGADPEEKGIPVQAVRPDSPADKAGLQVGDIIVKAGDTDIDGFSDLIQLIRNSKPGNQIEFSIQRGDEVLKLNATLAPPQ